MSQTTLMSWLEAVRRRPGMYVGGTDAAALHCCVSQLIDNSLEEHSAGRGLSITVTIHADGSLSVKDEGGGIPVTVDAKHKIPFIELALTAARAPKDWRNRHKRIFGLHGVGTKCVNALSEWMQVNTVWKGYEYQIAFAQGRLSEPLTKLGAAATARGTTVRFKPDSKIFHDSGFDRNRLAIPLEHLAILYPRLETWLVDERPNSANRPLVACFSYPNGIADFLDLRFPKESRRHPKPITFCSDTHGIKITLGFQFVETGDTSLLSFANSAPTQRGGTHVQGFLQGLTVALSEQTRKRRTLGLNDIHTGLNAVVAVWLRDPYYGGATKDELMNPEIETAVRALTVSGVRKWATESGKQAKWLAESLDKARRARHSKRD
jgi:DNA gyrase subunit B